MSDAERPVTDAEREFWRRRAIDIYVNWVASFYRFEGATRQKKVKAWTDELVTTEELASVHWDALRDEAHAHQMEREYRELYRQYNELRNDLRATG